MYVCIYIYIYIARERPQIPGGFWKADFPKGSATTQECRTDLGKQVSSHGICMNFPKFRFFSGDKWG